MPQALFIQLPRVSARAARLLIGWERLGLGFASYSGALLKIPQYFSVVEVFPSLLHGDLWSGSAAEMADGPVIFDPAPFYGHHEYDLAIAAMFGGFSQQFWDEYHALIPKTAGWNN
ncbi:hypothetical protein O3P69_012780 [Scylla paramamosain]|uniref:protein-ribulosamine 3-kinase n=1 Tax=Scylla paramamosain TaxID=85552 RepID=A0AAW0SIY4_SCYPA